MILFSDSGYPVVTHMDISDSNSDDFVLNFHQLETKGSWGLFHELGHNMQQGWWSKYFKLKIQFVRHHNVFIV